MAGVTGVQMVGLYVRDFDAAVRFYRDGLGLRLAVDAHGDYQHAELSFDPPYFHFALFPVDGANGTSRAHVTFVVTHIAAILDQLKGYPDAVSKPPYHVDYSSGGLSCELRDPDGNEIELFQPASNA